MLAKTQCLHFGGWGGTTGPDRPARGRARTLRATRRAHTTPIQDVESDLRWATTQARLERHHVTMAKLPRSCEKVAPGAECRPHFGK